MPAAILLPGFHIPFTIRNAAASLYSGVDRCDLEGMARRPVRRQVCATPEGKTWNAHGTKDRAEGDERGEPHIPDISRVGLYLPSLPSRNCSQSRWQGLMRPRQFSQIQWIGPMTDRFRDV